MIQALIGVARMDGDLLEPVERLVLLVLADHANERGICWPSLERIARRVGRSIWTVRRAIDRLEERDLLRVEERSGHSSLYHLNLARLLDLTPSTGATPSTHATPGMDATPSTGAPGPLAPVPTEPINRTNQEPTSSSPPYSPPHGTTPPPGVEEEGDENQDKPAKPPSERRGSGNEGSTEMTGSDEAKPPFSLGEKGVLGSSSSIPRAHSGMDAHTGSVGMTQAVGQALADARQARSMTREEALEELAKRKRPAPPPEVPKGMVLALREAGLWERLYALRRYARDNRAWQEWLALTLGPLWRATTPDAFTKALAEALDALVRRPEVSRPLGYLEAILRRALVGGEEPGVAPKEPVPVGQPAYSLVDLEKLFRDGVPFLDGVIGLYDGVVGTGANMKVVLRDPMTDAVSLLPVEEALKRVRS